MAIETGIGTKAPEERLFLVLSNNCRAFLAIPAYQKLHFSDMAFNIRIKANTSCFQLFKRNLDLWFHLNFDWCNPYSNDFNSIPTHLDCPESGRLSSTHRFSQSCISDSIHPTARPPNEICFGKLPTEIRRYIELLESPVRVLTSGSLKIWLTMFAPIGVSLNMEPILYEIKKDTST